MMFDNETKVFEYDYQDLTNQRPLLFGVEDLYVRIGGKSGTNGKYVEYLIDYIEAPFLEGHWVQTTAPTASTWLYNGWDGNVVEDNVDDESEFVMIVPRFDAMSSMMSLETTDAFASGDSAIFNISLGVIMERTGAFKELLMIEIGLFWGTSNTEGYLLVQMNDSTRELLDIDVMGDTRLVECEFSVAMTDNRKGVTLKVEASFDGDREGAKYRELYFGSSSFFAGYSAEFEILNQVWMDFDTDVEVTSILDRWDMIERDIFLQAALAWIGIDPWGIGMVLLKALFRLVVTSVATIGQVLSGDLSVIEGIQQIATTNIEAVADDIATLPADILAKFQQFIDDVWGVLDSIVGDIWYWFYTNVLTWLQPIIDYLISIAQYLWDIVVNIAFFVWDALNLPDVLAWVDLLLDYFVEFVQWCTDTATDLLELMWDMSWVILVLWWFQAVFIQFARAKGNPMEGVANFLGAYFKELIPFDVLGFHVYIPQGLAFTLWMELILPDDFFFWTVINS